MPIMNPKKIMKGVLLVEVSFDFLTVITWLYKTLALTYAFNFTGSFVYDLLNTIRRKNKFFPIQTALTAFITTWISIAIFEFWIKNPTFGMYAMLSIFLGFWSNNISYYVMNWNFAKKILGSAVGKAAGLNDKEKEELMKELDRIDEERKKTEAKRTRAANAKRNKKLEAENSVKNKE